MKTLKYVLVIIILLVVSQTTAQTDELNNIFTWRQAAMTLEYPAEWEVGQYADNPIIASDLSALTNANHGQAPGAPAITFLYYRQLRALPTTEFMNLLFPDVTTETSNLGLNGLQTTFLHEETNQKIQVIVFESPATRSVQAIMATAPSEQWDNFRDTLVNILASVQFMPDTANLELFGTQVVFEYPDGWAEASNGQVIVAAPNQISADTILTGNLDESVPFVRSQLLEPSGIGIDPNDPNAAVEILLRFVGLPLEEIEAIHRFEWATDIPAASARFEFNGLRLIMVAAINGNTAMLIGGGAPADTWEADQAIILGALNLTQFNEVAPPSNLTAIVTSEHAEEIQRFGAVVE